MPIVALAVDLPAGPPLRPQASAARRCFRGQTMGTTWQTDVFGLPGWADHVIQGGIERELERLVAQMSHWRADSDLNRFGRARPGEWVSLPAEFFQVLTAAIQVAFDSHGAFDPAVAPAVDCWGFGPSQLHLQVVPPASPVQVGVRAVELDTAHLRARQPGGVQLDFSAIAKGYAVDHLAHLLQEWGANDFLVEVGGEFRGHGVKPDGLPWWVAIEPPQDLKPEDSLLVGLSGLAVATSGDYRRYIELDGERFSHTIDPATGAPVRNALVSVTVIHEQCMLADAYSTAIFVLGSEPGLEWAARHGIAALVYERGPSGISMRCSPRFLEMTES